MKPHAAYARTLPANELAFSLAYRISAEAGGMAGRQSFPLLNTKHTSHFVDCKVRARERGALGGTWLLRWEINGGCESALPQIRSRTGVGDGSWTVLRNQRRFSGAASINACCDVPWWPGRRRCATNSQRAGSPVRLLRARAVVEKYLQLLIEPRRPGGQPLMAWKKSPLVCFGTRNGNTV
jgi:hypothetical protein